MDSIMKKTAFIIGLISLLTACNSRSGDRFMELPDTPAGKASISFDGARTRASLNTISSTFALYGTATDADNTSVVFNNQKIEYNNESTLWVYSPLKYWNTQADHKFGAYAPYNSSRNFSFNPEGFPMITGFMISQNVDNQESLLLSHPVDREVRAGGLDMSPVVFTFDPALTRINFRIKKESSLTDALHLNVLRMYNLKSSGNCTHNGNRIIWDTSSAPTNTFGYSTGFTNPQEVSYEGIIAWEDGALMVPQQISGITVYLSYTRRHNDLTYSYDKDNITLPGADWQPGQQITYVLTLKPENYIEIGEPIVEPWIDSPSGGGTIIVN